MKKIYYICAFVTIIILCAILYFYQNSTPKQTLVHQKCPDDYAYTDAGSAEYSADFDKWTNNFYDSHPGATLSDWASARRQFWVDNNCTTQLEGYQKVKDGTADPATLKLIEDIKNTIREGVKNPTK